MHPCQVLRHSTALSHVASIPCLFECSDSVWGGLQHWLFGMVWHIIHKVHIMLSALLPFSKHYHSPPLASCISCLMMAQQCLERGLALADVSSFQALAEMLNLQAVVALLNFSRCCLSGPASVKHLPHECAASSSRPSLPYSVMPMFLLVRSVLNAAGQSVLANEHLRWHWLADFMLSSTLDCVISSNYLGLHVPPGWIANLAAAVMLSSVKVSGRATWFCFPP